MRPLNRPRLEVYGPFSSMSSNSTASRFMIGFTMGIPFVLSAACVDQAWRGRLRRLTTL